MTIDFYGVPSTFVVPADWALNSDARADLSEATWRMVLRGASNVDEYLELFEEELKEAGVPEEAASRFFSSVIAHRRDQQASWGEASKSRLTAAFNELAEIGVIARQDFSCCGTCGSSEIFDERDDSRIWRGYVYFHSQDTDRIFEARQTYVGYGAFPDAYFSSTEWKAYSDAEKDTHYTRIVRELMAEVRIVLERHDIGTEWDGELRARILLYNVDFLALMPATD